MLSAALCREWLLQVVKELWVLALDNSTTTTPVHDPTCQPKVKGSEPGTFHLHNPWIPRGWITLASSCDPSVWWSCFAKRTHLLTYCTPYCSTSVSSIIVVWAGPTLLVHINVRLLPGKDLSSTAPHITQGEKKTPRCRGFAAPIFLLSLNSSLQGRLDFFSSNKRKNTFSRAAAGEIFFSCRCV